ncbi:MAG: threonine--tRNA ligase [Clostridiaceae bacterium]|nr:threonine--tRNA ligase [Clostridiaceae bacterium]
MPIYNHQDLYSTADEVGQGLIMWHPKAAMVRYQMEKFAKEAHVLNGYQWVCTPHIGKEQLWETSGHLQFYRDAMYGPIDVDGEAYRLKPMSCPFHVMIYKANLHSYRDLPVRLAEFASVYRYELSGALNGMTRVRGFTQDDAHIICTEDQVIAEIQRALEFSLYILRSFGFEKYQVFLSTRPEKKSIGREEDWQLATESLIQALKSAHLDYEIDAGGGAFYGPKIDLKLLDASGQTWQCSTIQFDFNLPARFAMAYVGPDGKNHTPFMVHRALFGSLERFFALLHDHYQGAYPLWLAPVQTAILPVTSAQQETAQALYDSLRRLGYRIKIVEPEGTLGNRIRQLEPEQLPCQVVIGEKEQAENLLSVRWHGSRVSRSMPAAEWLDYLADANKAGQARCLD